VLLRRNRLWVIGAAILVMSTLVMHSYTAPTHDGVGQDGAGRHGQVSSAHQAGVHDDSPGLVGSGDPGCAGDACGHPLEHAAAGCVMALLVLGAARLLTIARSGVMRSGGSATCGTSVASGLCWVRRTADPPDIHVLSVIRC